MSNTRPAKRTPEPEEVPHEAQYTARGLKRWIEARRSRGVPVQGTVDRCNESCTLHDHSE